MSEAWERDGSGDFGPANDDDWVVESLNEIPIEQTLNSSKPLLSPSTCHVLIERYNIPEKKKFYFPVEEDQYRNRKALYAEKFAPMDGEFDYREIWQSKDYQEYKHLSDGPAERFGMEERRRQQMDIKTE